MSIRAFGPASHINVDEFARRLRAPSRLPRISESSSRLSECAPNTPERGGTGKESIEPLDLRSPPQLHLKPGGGASIVDADDPRTVDDLRRWRQKRLPQGAAQDHSRRQKLTRMAIALAGIALVSSALAPTLLKRPPVAPLANDTVRAETAGTPADISSTSPTGVSAATPVAPEVDAHAVEGLASKASPQMTDPESARTVSLRADGTQIAAEPGSAAAVKPASGPVNGADGTARPSFILPAKRPEAAIPSAAADTPSAPLPIGTPERHALQRMVESVVASATPAEARAAGSTGWVVQLGAASSEAEAKRDLKRLNKYGSALKGSTVGLRKVLVSGETVYRVNVAGLSRGKAASLCSRVKGDGGSCSIVR
jgi:hypothetical protein